MLNAARYSLALQDIFRGAAAYHIWGQLGWHDIKQRYRRSMLGPLWLTVSNAVFIGAIGLLYSKFFGQAADEYLPFLAAGFIVWMLIVTTVNESCGVFTQAESLIRQIKLPLSVHLYRLLWRNVLIYAHNFLIIPPVLLLLDRPVTWQLLLVPIGLALVVLNCFWIGLLLGIVCARFRDIPQVVSSLMQVAFFMSPIIWAPGILGNRMWVAQFNPIYHLIEIVRAPIIGAGIPGASLAVCGGMAVTGTALCVTIYAAFRHRVPYWL